MMLDTIKEYFGLPTVRTRKRAELVETRLDELRKLFPQNWALQCAIWDHEDGAIGASIAFDTRSLAPRVPKVRYVLRPDEVEDRLQFLRSLPTTDWCMTCRTWMDVDWENTVASAIQEIQPRD